MTDYWRDRTSITYPSGRMVTYTLDQAGKVTQVDTVLNGNPKTLASSITYLPYGGITGLTYGNTLSLSHGYDNQYRTSSIVVGSILNRTYNYDANGNITYIDDAEAAGNETLESAGIYSFDQGTNLLADIKAESPVIYDYDENGNTISANNRTFTYDLSNRLITVQEGSATLGQYVYNALNQRIKKIVQGQTTIFHYDLRGHLTAETTETGGTLVEYFYLGGQPLAMIRPSEALYYYHNDHLGTPQILTNDSGTVSWKAAYTPFGEAEISIGTVENNIRLPGQYYDQETGLHYNWNRYYDPKTGRYLTPDPIGLQGGINVFIYAKNMRTAEPEPVYPGDPPPPSNPLIGPRQDPNPHDRAPRAAQPNQQRCQWKAVLLEVCLMRCCEIKCQGEGPWWVAPGTECPCSNATAVTPSGPSLCPCVKREWQRKLLKVCDRPGYGLSGEPPVIHRLDSPPLMIEDETGIHPYCK